jgi:hypothetical protein
MTRTDRLMALAAFVSLAAHLTLVAALPGPSAGNEDAPPLAAELQPEPPPETIPPRRLPPKPRAPKPVPVPLIVAGREA